MFGGLSDLSLQKQIVLFLNEPRISYATIYQVIENLFTKETVGKGNKILRLYGVIVTLYTGI